MNSLDQWTDDVLSIGRESRLTATTANPLHENGRRHLRRLGKKHRKDDERPTLLWNTRPADHVNLLHAVYLQKLLHLQECGFNVTIIVYDLWYGEEQRLSPTEMEEAQIVARQFADEILDWDRGFDPRRTEILLESDLRSSLDPNKLIQNINMIANSDSVADSDVNVERSDPSELLHGAIEICYEVELDCDVILAGTRDTEGVWNLLRNVVSNEKFFDSYTEPLVLGVPQMKLDNGETLSPTKPSFVYDGMDSAEMEAALRNTPGLTSLVFEFFVCQRIEDVPVSIEQYREYSTDRKIEFLLEQLESVF